jgi:RimJ/RimL family protein N-acetyltransferase
MSDSWLRFVTDPNPWKAPRPLPAEAVTPRAVVRLYRKGDGPALYAAIDRSREALQPEMVWTFTNHHDVDDSIHFVEHCRRAAEAEDCLDFPMGIFDRETGEVIGGTGLHRIRPGRREGEIGYWISGHLHGRGLCTEAIGALMTCAFTPASEGGWGFRRIVITNSEHNVASRRVCEKLGLRLEMRMRKERWFGPPGVEAGYVDTRGYAVLAEEWDAAAHRAKPGIGWV